MHEVMIKTHLIITDMHNEYHMDWRGSILNAKPKIEDGKPVFIIRSKQGAIEMNTTDAKYLERVAKKMTEPRGRSAVTTDKAVIYLKQIDGTEKLMGVLTHNKVKKFAPMYDSVNYR